MRAFLPGMFGLVGCFSAPARPDNPVDAPATIMTGYHRTVTITVPPATELQRFPVSVMLAADPALAAHATSAENIAFTTADDVVLDCEIVDYQSDGTLEAWVVLPTLSTTSNAQFELVYGPEVASPCRRQGPWSEFHGVWHLSDATPGIAIDSSSFAHTAVAGTAGGGMRAPGLVGASVRFDPVDADGADQLCVRGAPGLNFGSSSFSVDVWVQQETFVGEYDEAVYKGGSNVGNAGFDFELGSNAWGSFVRDTSTAYNHVLFAADGAPLLNQWVYLALVVDRESGQVRGYRDGIRVEDEPIVATTVSGPEPFCIGNNVQPMHGRLDEVRVHDRARPDAWFFASYLNVHERDQFMTISSER